MTNTLVLSLQGQRQHQSLQVTATYNDILASVEAGCPDPVVCHILCRAAAPETNGGGPAH